jgi:hypothetical protein
VVLEVEVVQLPKQVQQDFLVIQVVLQLQVPLEGQEQQVLEVQQITQVDVEDCLAAAEEEHQIQVV